MSSILHGRHGRLTGIARVELEVGRRLVAEGAQAIRWDEQRARFVTVDFVRVVECIAEAHALDIEDVLDAPRTDGRPHPVAHAALGASTRLASQMSLLRGVAIRGLAAMHPSLSPQERRRFAGRVGIADSRQAVIDFLLAFVAARNGVPETRRQGEAVRFMRGDVVATLSIWWDQRAFDALRQADVALLGWVHDLILIRRPDLAPRALGVDAFRGYATGLVRDATMLCAGTSHVARDIESWADTLATPAPPVQVVPLCSDLPQRVSPRLTPFLAAHGLEPGRFVLFVSSINPRKNHAWAYRLWRRALESMGEGLPTLVFAGEPRWDDDGLMAMLQTDARMWGRHLKFVSSPTDSELAWLYRHCAYTIFPSLVEGWGLPITESLSYGKHCLAAADASLREAGAGLAFHADTRDEAAWLEEIGRLARAPDYLAGRERSIAAGYRARGWDDVARDVADAVSRARLLHAASAA